MNGTEQAQPGDAASAVGTPFRGRRSDAAQGRRHHDRLAHGRAYRVRVTRAAAVAPTSAIAASTFSPHTFELHLRTTRGDRILVDLPLPWDLAPVRERPVIYLDQNQWSTLTNTIHHRDRVDDHDELAAAGGQGRMRSASR